MNSNKPLEPLVLTNSEERDKISSWVPLLYYYCPKCKAFQYPNKIDFKGTIAECPYCKQQIEYKRYFKGGGQE